jgi:hypothetical protein
MTGRQRSPVMILTVLFLMAVFVFLAYSNTLHSPFVFDDVHNIVDNPYVRVKHLSFESFSEAARKSPTSSRWLPNISLALNYYFGGMAVEGYHLVNITIHILCGIVLYYLTRATLSLLPQFRVKGNVEKIAFFASLLWLLHPVQTNGVTYIVQRMTSLATLFVLLSLLAYVKGRKEEQPGRRNLLLLFSVISGICALFSKENAIMVVCCFSCSELFLQLRFISRAAIPLLLSFQATGAAISA